MKNVKTSSVILGLDIICQTFWKLISTLDSGVFIFYLYSLACCFLIHCFFLGQLQLTCRSCSAALKTSSVILGLDIICQTFWKLISTLDSGVFIFYLYSLACCFLIHSEKRLWSNLALTYLLEDTKYFVISEVC